ncbi:MAG: T9SS type A sorting domain-containing protein [Acidobacteriaceae bacterium]
MSAYPNPFSQRTTISFSSAAPGFADVRIVNLLGAEVARLYSGDLSAGEHSFVWSTHTALPAGMYECEVQMWDKPPGLSELRIPLLLMK